MTPPATTPTWKQWPDVPFVEEPSCDGGIPYRQMHHSHEWRTDGFVIDTNPPITWAWCVRCGVRRRTHGNEITFHAPVGDRRAHKRMVMGGPIL